MQLSSSALLCWFEIGCWGKRHFGDYCIIRSASHNDLELSVLLAVLLVHISHGNVLLQAWTESAAGNLSNLQSTGHIGAQGMLDTGAGRGGRRGCTRGLQSIIGHGGGGGEGGGGVWGCPGGCTLFVVYALKPQSSQGGMSPA